MPRKPNPMLADRAVFSVSVPTRDRDLAEVRTHIERELGRAVAWHEVIEYLYRFWKEAAERVDL